MRNRLDSESAATCISAKMSRNDGQDVTLFINVKIIDRDNDEMNAIMDQLASVRCHWNGNDETYRPDLEL